MALEAYPIPEDNNPTVHQLHCYARQGFLLGCMKTLELVNKEIEKRVAEGSSKMDISEGAIALEKLSDYIDTLI